MSQIKEKIHYEARLKKKFKDKYGSTHKPGTVIGKFKRKEFEELLIQKKMSDRYTPQITHGHGDYDYLEFHMIDFVKVIARIIATEEIVKPKNIKKGE